MTLKFVHQPSSYCQLALYSGFLDRITQVSPDKDLGQIQWHNGDLSGSHFVSICVLSMRNTVRVLIYICRIEFTKRAELPGGLMTKVQIGLGIRG